MMSKPLLLRAQILGSILGGAWDLVITFNWDYNRTYNWGSPISPFRGVVSRVISPVISGY